MASAAAQQKMAAAAGAAAPQEEEVEHGPFPVEQLQVRNPSWSLDPVLVFPPKMAPARSRLSWGLQSSCVGGNAEGGLPHGSGVNGSWPMNGKSLISWSHLTP
jgi:hypothetical protein